MFKGRINRAVYWLGIVLIAVLYVVANLYLQKKMPISEIVLVILCVPRLHDIGRSGWLVLVPIALEIAGAVAAFTFFPPDTALAVMGGVSLIIAGLLIWLGAIPGDPAPNRFGEPPLSGLKSRPRAKST